MVVKRIEFILLLVCLITNLIDLNKIYISSDHAGFKLKQKIISYLKKKKFRIFDLGPSNDSSVDYPDYAKKLAKIVGKNKKNRGILVCGSGVGMSMSANKVKNIRAALCYSIKNTKLSRLHNDANIISLGSRLISAKLALNCVNIFLKTRFESGRHLRRVKKIK